MANIANRADALQVYDPLLTEFAVSYRPSGFVYDQLVADVGVGTFTGIYRVFDDSYWFQQQTDDRIEDRTPANEVDFEFTTAQYRAIKRGLKVSVSDDEREQAGAAQINLEMEKVQFLNHQIALTREIRLANLLLPTGSGGSLSLSSTPSVNWDQDTATIEADIKSGVLNVYDTIGIRPNTILIPFKVAYAMAVQQDIRDILAMQISGVARDPLRVGDRILPGEIHGMSVIIPEGAQKDTANEGGAAARTEIWGDDVRLLYINSDAGAYQPSVVKRFVHTGPQVFRWRTNDPEVDYIKNQSRYDEKIVASSAAHVLLDVLS